MDTTYIIYETVGYIASALIVISLMMSGIVRLRIVNMMGALTFTLYGIMIGSIPVAAMNGILVFVNIFYLARIYGSEEFFSLLRVGSDDSYLRYFLDFYKEEIAKSQPGFQFDPEKSDICVFVLRDMVPAGLLIGDLDENGNMTVELDFVIPNYRDFKIGKYLFYDQAEYLRSLGVKLIFARAGSEMHNKYLSKIGFEPVSDNPNLVQLRLS